MSPKENLPETYAPSLLGAIGLISAVAIVYLAREILIPLVLGILLSFLTAPLVRLFHRIGFGRGPATVLAVFLPLLVGLFVAGSLAKEVTELVSDLPKYGATLRTKLGFIESNLFGNAATAVASVRKIWTDTGPQPPSTPTNAFPNPSATNGDRIRPPIPAPLPVEVREAAPTTYEMLGRISLSVIQPLGMAILVLAVWTFTLLERQALRDRFIRLVGSGDVHRTTIALDDAAARLSRFFAMQFGVNVGVGLFVAAGLTWLGVPGAMLLGVMTVAFRFLPYVGIAVATVLSTLVAAGVDAGWTSAILTLVLFSVVEVVVGQFVEPLLYGRTTGMAPVSVVISVIFWGWMWGPAGVLLATPLTLCLVVLGRHLPPLKFLDILLGDAPALNLYQNLYQRILSGDAEEAIERGRQFVATNGFIAYCDSVIFPALQLATSELSAGILSAEYEVRVERTFAKVIDALSDSTLLGPNSIRRESISDVSAPLLEGARRIARTRSSSAKPGGSAAGAVPTILCIGLDEQPDEIASDVLTRVLLQIGLHAIRVTRSGLTAFVNSLDPPTSWETILLVSVVAGAIDEHAHSVARQAREKFPDAYIVSLFQPSFYFEMRPKEVKIPGVNFAAHSIAEAAQLCLDRHQIEQSKFDNPKATNVPG